ncbi:hypothetical protein [Micromonospora sp. NPDC005324]|uniref:hypothetical protein n=1 Tax=Micromonospora sp. NPDC005324 TaxID=3157033 RepID=UPI0033BDD4B5
MTVPTAPDRGRLLAELARHDWQALKSFKGSAVDLPSAITDLVFAGTEAAADRAYWQIDNTALIQGRLSQCCPAVVSCLVVGLVDAPAVSRSLIIDLLATIGGGYDDHVDSAWVGPVSSHDCIQRMAVGFETYERELRERGNASCVDILFMCGKDSAQMLPRVRQVLVEALALPSCRPISDLIESSLADLD